MMEYPPDSWVILKITPLDNPVHYKVLGGWSGGYLQGDSWKLNSGIINVQEDETYFYFSGYSGSVYKVRKTAERFNNIMSAMYNAFKGAHGDCVTQISVKEFLDEFESEKENYQDW